jgi:hypothetical protein
MQGELEGASRVPDPGVQAEFAQLRAELAQQRDQLALLLAERAERPTRAAAAAPRAGNGAKRTAGIADPAAPAGQPTSRRRLLKRLGTSAAGAAVAATALGATRPERAAADAAVTLNGLSTNQYGVYASPNNISRPAVPATVFTGVLGSISAGTNLSVLAATHAAGVAGVANTAAGVVGVASDQGLGVGGICIAESPRPLSATSAGVAGVSTTRAGVCGISGSNHGVFGQSQAPAGTVVDSGFSYNPGEGLLAAGVAGRTTSTIALYGYTDGPPNPNYAPIGGVGQCQSGIGVWGLSSAPPNTVSRPGGGTSIAVSGVLGTSTNGVGVYAISSGSYALAADGNGPGTVGALIRGLGGANAAVFVGNVQIQGHLSVSGGINRPSAAAPADSRGTTAASPNLQAVQSLEAVVEAFGDGRLVGGQATVRFDAALVALLADDQYHVVLTEYGDHNALYVAQRTRDGFTVRAKDSPTASGTFSYCVVARTRPAQAAADPTSAALHTPTIPVPQGVPTLPVGRESPPPPARKPDAR